MNRISQENNKCHFHQSRSQNAYTSQTSAVTWGHDSSSGRIRILHSCITTLTSIQLIWVLWVSDTSWMRYRIKSKDYSYRNLWNNLFLNQVLPSKWSYSCSVLCRILYIFSKSHHYTYPGTAISSIWRPCNKMLQNRFLDSIRYII